MRKLTFKKSLTDTLKGNAGAMDLYSKQFGVSAAGAKLAGEMHSEIDARAAKSAARKPRQEYAGATEGEIQKSIISWLLLQPYVMFVIRQNSGAAESETGNPIWFHKLYIPSKARDKKFRVVDLYVMLRSGQSLVVEVKRGDWTRPKDEREREQANYIEHVKSCGNLGCFAVSIDDVAWTLKAAGY